MSNITVLSANILNFIRNNTQCVCPILLDKFLSICKPRTLTVPSPLTALLPQSVFGLIHILLLAENLIVLESIFELQVYD